MNALVNAAMRRGNLLARGGFDSLPIRFRAVATDLANRQSGRPGRRFDSDGDELGQAKTREAIGLAGVERRARGSAWTRD